MSKKGNSERIYRNTILFLACTETGLSQLCEQVREYLACKKIAEEYKVQLEKEQQEDLKRKIAEVSGLIMEGTLVSAYVLLVKCTAKQGIAKLVVRQSIGIKV